MSDTHTHMEMEKETAAKSDVALREEAVLAFWREHDIFNKSLEKDAPNGDFVFYDGPPFATGLPHYGHILASTIKDAVPRFWSMNGYRVARKWGWDCHGLPLENLIEKELGLATKRDIEEYGVKNFNEKARTAVMRYADDWAEIIPRMGRWADMEDDYKTMDSTYTESVWWVFKSLHEKGLVYEGFKSMHLCPRCGTTLSNFEVNQGYKDIKDIAVTVKLPLLDDAGAVTDTSLLVWTTTPWTLPGNMAAAVHKDVTYAKVKVTNDQGSELVIIAKERLTQLDSMETEVVEEFSGGELVDRSYQPPFSYFKNETFENKENAWKIWHADYVEIGEEGTGAVHIAPAYGEDDLNLAKENDIPIVHHVNESGHFKEIVANFVGQLVKPKDDDDAGVDHKDADIQILKHLQATGAIFKKENITHSYPHCWRCDTPLLNYATTSWFVEVTKIKNDLVAENEKVSWVPEHVGTNRFGKWLEGARDWAVSRQRYWGAPLPVWRNPETKEYKVFGSLAELQEYVPKSGNTYTLMRHAEAGSNITGVINAINDKQNGLTEKGRTQCVEAAALLKDKNIDLIIHSGMLRTQATAALVAEALGLGEDAIVVDNRVTELQTGAALEGKSWSEYETLFTNDEEKYTKQIDGVENRFDVMRRVGEFLYEIEQKHQGKHILIVGHASSLLALEAVAQGADMKQALALRARGYMDNAEVRPLLFMPLPHNDNYTLDYHRPYIDDIALYEDGVKLERVPDVFDCWFESGSMPYGQHHYPFANQEAFEKKLFPANFIAEGLDQTRGWFYSLIVLGTALFGKSPFENVIVNGLVLAEDGKKMSKSLQNYPDPMLVADTAGVDAMRMYLLSSPVIRGEDLHFSEKGVLELQRKNIGRLHNVLAMYEMYADGAESRSDSAHILDRWIVSRLHQLVAEVTEGYKSYELDKATRPITDFIDDLSVWYLRRSRDRLKSEDATDKAAALSTLRHVLSQLSLVMAPVMPFYAEYLWRAVRSERDAESVHLAKWPESRKVDTPLLTRMGDVRSVVSNALEQRTKLGIKVRQPLGALRIDGLELSDELKVLIKDEVNVEEVHVYPAEQRESTHKGGAEISGMAVELDPTITPLLKAKGDARELMRAIQDMRKKADLAPADRIELTFQTSDGGEELVKQFEGEIMKTVGAESFAFGPANGDEITAGEHSFTIELKKV